MDQSNTESATIPTINNKIKIKSDSIPLNTNTNSKAATTSTSKNNNNSSNISYLHGNNRVIAHLHHQDLNQSNGKISLEDEVSDDTDEDDEDGTSHPSNKTHNSTNSMVMNANGSAIRQNIMKAKRTDVSSGRWTVDEQKTFVKGIEMYGKEWKKIALMIPTRTVVQIRTHAQKYFIKLARKEAIANNNPLLFNPKVSISSNPLKSSSVANVSPLSIHSTKPAMHETLSPSVSSDSDSSASSLSSMKKNSNNNKLQIKRSRLSYAKIPTDEAISPKMESKCIKQQVNTNANSYASNKHQRSDTMASDELDLSRQLVVKKQKKTQTSTSSVVSITNDRDEIQAIKSTGSVANATISINCGKSLVAASQSRCEEDTAAIEKKKKNKILLPVAYEEESMEDGDHNIESSPCGISDLFYIFPNDPSHLATFPPLPKNEGSELLNMMAIDAFGDDDVMDIATPLKQKISPRMVNDSDNEDDDTHSIMSNENEHNGDNYNKRKAVDIVDNDALYSTLVAVEVLDDPVFDVSRSSQKHVAGDNNNKNYHSIENKMMETQENHVVATVPHTPPRSKMAVPKEMYSPMPLSLFNMTTIIGEKELNDIFDEWKSSDATILASSAY